MNETYDTPIEISVDRLMSGESRRETQPPQISGYQLGKPLFTESTPNDQSRINTVMD